MVPHVETVVGQLVAADLLPAVWFIFSRKGCDQAAEYLCQCGASLVSGAERRKIAEALTAFETDNPDAVRPEAVEPLLLGIASHHAGLLPGWKGLVESLFQRGLLKVVFATETPRQATTCRRDRACCRERPSDDRTSNAHLERVHADGRKSGPTRVRQRRPRGGAAEPFEGPEEAFALVTSPPRTCGAASASRTGWRLTS